MVYICISAKAKKVTIIAAGYGKRIKEQVLKDIAGAKGHHLLFKNVDDLAKKVDVIVADACGKNKIEASQYQPEVPVAFISYRPFAGPGHVTYPPLNLRPEMKRAG